MHNRDSYSSAGLLVLAVIVGVQAIRFPFGTLKRLGPGFFPLALSILLGILSLHLLIKTIHHKKEESKIEWPRRWGGLILVMIAIFAFSLLLKPLGFLVTTVLFTFVVFKFADPNQWLAPLATSVVATLVSFVVFKIWLGIPFPMGFLGF
jgi:hypothetical protein